MLRKFKYVPRQCLDCFMSVGSFSKVLRVFLVMFIDVSILLIGCFRDVMIKIKGVSRNFKRCFENVARVYQGSLWRVSRVIQKCFKAVII